ncbi:ATP-binding protein [Verrucomicrobia bacterium]|nr:ATP-binding protein [Verrucomicrobiota bacterium]
MILQRKEYQHRIKERLMDYPVLALLGPRQVGKTTMARTFGKMLAPENQVHFFDLESPADLARLTNPELVLESLNGFVVLDEIQRKPDLFPLLRVLVDRPDNPARFLFLGSASPSLIKGTSDSLAGRISFIDIHGFSLRELGPNCLSDRWWRGGFPRSYLARNDSTARQWHEDFFRTFLERDIPQLGISIPSTTLRRFWTMVAHYHGQIVKLSELARSIGSTEPTARRYLDILSGTYVVRQLPPWFENLKKRQVKSPKVYIRDSGICHALLGIQNRKDLQANPKLGASWEGFCIEQILDLTGDRNAYFWATHSGAELDLLLFHQGKRLGFEFKYSETPQVTKSMRIAQEDLKLDHLYVVHPGKHSFPLDTNLEATTLPDMLDALSNPE